MFFNKMYSSLFDSNEKPKRSQNSLVVDKKCINLIDYQKKKSDQLGTLTTTNIRKNYLDPYTDNNQPDQKQSDLISLAGAKKTI